ncbi:endo alpha-1,4 polygalactosaminidase [Polaromonas sp.]|uniref:endo alpha-1,4 polygalactosaminidase n=1 Tax=Polaromonas sp. TaxID=1869339 RepID=UPI0025E8E6D3|nr:endo alpha-1,4 polygalactosaminidase [Polaromonas sp.]
MTIQPQRFTPPFATQTTSPGGSFFTTLRYAALLATASALSACGGGGGGGATSDTAALQTSTQPALVSATPETSTSLQTTSQPAQTSLTSATPTSTTGRGFPAGAPWASFYGSAGNVDIPKMAATFRIMDIDADPDLGNFTPAQIKQLQSNGQNKVLSYLNLGSCESFRGYWSKVPAGLLSCAANTSAQAGTYSGYSNEVWMNLGNPEYQRLVLDYIAPRLAAQGVDGFYFDNMEIVEHGTNTTNGPCDAKCSQGGLDLIAKLRDKYPNLLFVMQNAVSDTTRLGRATGASGTVAYPSLLDGIAHEEVYKPTFDAYAETALTKWAAMNLMPGGQKFWIATLDYVGSCTNTADAQSAFSSSRARGFSPSVSDASAGQQAVCYW